MKRWITFGLLLLFSVSGAAEDGSRVSDPVNNDQVKYVGGTVPGVTSGMIGRLDTTSETALTFDHAGSKIAIPYDAIQSFAYSQEVAHHLGVLPLIAVSLFRMRRHRHFFRITYQGQDKLAGVVVFEVPKQMPRTLQAILEARAPNAMSSCAPCNRD